MNHKNRLTWPNGIIVCLLALTLYYSLALATEPRDTLDTPLTVQLISTRSKDYSLRFLKRLERKMEPSEFAAVRLVYVEPFYTVRVGRANSRTEALLLLKNIKTIWPDAILIESNKPEVMVSGAEVPVDAPPASSIAIQPFTPAPRPDRDDVPSPPRGKSLPAATPEVSRPAQEPVVKDISPDSNPGPETPKPDITAEMPAPDSGAAEIKAQSDPPTTPLAPSTESPAPGPSLNQTPNLGISALAGALRIVPGITLKQEHNDNIGFHATSKMDDDISTISPSLKIEARQERYSFILEDQVDFLIYADHDQFNSVDNTLSGAFEFAATPRLSTSLAVKLVRDSRADRDIEATGLADGTSRRETQSYSGSASYMISEKALAGISLSHGKTDYDDPGFIGSRTQGAGVNFGYSLDSWLPESTARIYLNTTRYDYPGSEIKNYSATTGMEHHFTETVSGYAYLGGRHTRSKIDFLNSSTDSWGGAGQAQLRYSGEKTSTALNLTHDIATGRSDTTGVTERSSASIDIGSRLTSEWSINLTTSYHLNRSERRTLAGTEVDEHTLRVVPSIRYNYSPELFFILSYAYVLHDNRELDVKKEQNRVFLRMVLEHAIFE